MTALVVLMAASLLMAMSFLGAFLWAVRRGQYRDDRTPALRMLHDDITPGVRTHLSPPSSNPTEPSTRSAPE